MKGVVDKYELPVKPKNKKGVNYNEHRKKHLRLIGMSNHDERELNAVEEVTKYISKKFFQKCNN